MEQKAVDPGSSRPLCPSWADGLGRSGNWESNIGTDLDPVGPGASAREVAMADEGSDDITLATITITKVLTDDDVLVYVDAVVADGEDLALIEALGMMALANDTLIRQAMGED